MVVELRGPLKQLNSFSKQQSTSYSASFSSTEIERRGNESKEKQEWVWSGVWSFGSLSQSNNQQQQARKFASKRIMNNNAPKPFKYNFNMIVDPSTIEVPSTFTNVTTPVITTATTTTTISNESSNSHEELKQTFGSNNYKDANKKYPQKCPKGGSWVGYFENIPTGASLSSRSSSSSKKNNIDETFFLFFNSNPAPNSTISFLDTNAHLPQNHVHVQGMGSNIFGTFEIIGSFDLDTCILHCQRNYLPLVVADASAELRKTEEKRKYFTRKKIMSWQRASDEEEKKPLPSAKKRPRASSVPPPNVEKPLELPPPQPLPSTSLVVEEKSPAAPFSSSSTSRKKSREDKKQIIHLPMVGNPMDARWKAAHFIFYQRSITTNPSVDDNQPPTTTTSTSTCVYEGEFLKGYGMREGRGVCLYPNGNIYEGSFKRNKESGFGTLYSGGDRKKILYQGDWDRGKMHGRGKYIYYYTDALLLLENQESSTNNSTPGGVSSNNSMTIPTSLVKYAKRNQKNQGESMEHLIIGTYQGDFKENVRHGYGSYSLPDGSIYEGEFQNNVFFGKGTFTWPDGTIYSGSWRDGKRHGYGLLKTSDHFVYEGNWNSNAMDGRGTCIYANQQKYEGLFSLGKKEGRGTVKFTNGTIYEGRFKEDGMEGQGTMKMLGNVSVVEEDQEHPDKERSGDWMIPIEFQSDMEHIHQKAGFDTAGG